MQFTSFEFALFFLLVLVGNWRLKAQTRPYRIFLLLANLVFYASLNPRFLPLLLAVGLIDWAGARLMANARETRKKTFLAVAVTLNLSLLAFFKYFEFFYTSLQSGLLALGLPQPFPPVEIPFPVGLSFFTFQGLSYLVDSYRDPRATPRGLLDVMLFVSFFPTVLSGPIMRAGVFLPQLAKRYFDPRAFHLGFALILGGLFKKIVLASYLSEHIVRQVFQVPGEYSSLTVLMGIYAYSIQIFCDFSGYSDLAMGLALLLGFNVPENFTQPYAALNLQDFWRRWHISLSTWLRDYLYISLGGNRRGQWGKYRNLMITMVLGGLWHGAHARFLLWGFLHGLGLTLTHFWRDHAAAARARSGSQPGIGAAPRAEFWTWLRKTAAWLATFNAVSFLWVFFRAEDAGRAFEIFRAALSLFQPGEGFELMVIPAILTGLALQFLGKWFQDIYLAVQDRLPTWLQAVTIAVICVIILRLGPEGVLPFIYFQF